MKCSEKLKLVLAGAGGYGRFYLEALARPEILDKAEFSGRLKLIDDFTTFDNDRFSEIAANSKMITEVTAAELEGMANVKAILVDKEWFQIYDNLFEMDGTKVISGKY